MLECVAGGDWVLRGRNFDLSCERRSAAAVIEALKVCGKGRDLDRGREIHAAAVRVGYDANPFVASSLVSMYAKCGCLEDARVIFDRIKPQYRDVVLWNSLLFGYVDNGESGAALDLFFKRMEVPPNVLTFVAVLKACTALAVEEQGSATNATNRIVKVWALETGTIIHSRALEIKLDAKKSGFLASSLIDMYAKCGCMTKSREVFNSVPRRDHDTALWNALMLGYAENGDGEQALDLLGTMFADNLEPNARSFVAALSSCSALATKEDGVVTGDGSAVKFQALEKGMYLHSLAARLGWSSDIFVQNVLLDFYSKCGRMEIARAVFDGMQRHDIVSWNSLLSGYVHNGESKIALECFQLMFSRGFAANSMTYVAALKACSGIAETENATKLSSLEEGMFVHCLATKNGFHSNVFVASAIVNMYGKCGSLADARAVFESVAASHNVVLWNVMLSACADNGLTPDSRTFVTALKACTSLAENEDGHDLAGGKLVKVRTLEKGMAVHSYRKRLNEVEDIFVGNSLVEMYCKCGSTVDAGGVFHSMKSHDVASRTCLLLGYVDNGACEEALELFLDMKAESSASDSGTLVAGLKACGGSSALEVGKAIHGELCRHGYESMAAVLTSLVDFYGKSGAITSAQGVFDSTYIETKDVLTWTALLAGYSRHGHTAFALETFQAMRDKDLQPTSVTFLAILTACSHAGLVNTGKKLFRAMECKFGVPPTAEHYQCMVDLLGRANLLEEAVAMVETIPFEASVLNWTTILGACNKWKNLELGKKAFDSIVSLGGNKDGSYCLMANLYASEQESRGV